ncbi:glycerate kinase [Odoribacter sp. OttesenSCG-928-J03]|nr:glycerate kinase [Odoribacter sp. OttesenSCG-928-J03]MDL2331193.1 glycerate kinase [Odoribacter sp. OttesenSCG-928-A06]
MLKQREKGIIVAPNSFKGSLDTFRICEIIKEELACLPTPIFGLPMGDGGDGSVDVIAHYTNAVKTNIITCDAFGRSNQSAYYRSGDTAIIGLAEICGIKLLNTNEYDVLNASTSGLGIAINHAIDHGAKHILLCLGGSASIDAGLGALEIMGLDITSTNTKYNNKLIDLKGFDTTTIKKKFKDVEWTILCDVETTLYGTNGAAYVFGKQKGASPSQISLLDEKLKNYATHINTYLGKDISDMRHGGAAGGISFSFAALLNARLISGADYCINLSGFKDIIKRSSWVITGEGKLDYQSLYGKIPGRIAELSGIEKTKVIAISGDAEGEFPMFDHIYTLSKYASSLSDSITNAEKYLRLICQKLVAENYFQ